MSGSGSGSKQKSIKCQSYTPDKKDLTLDKETILKHSEFIILKQAEYCKKMRLELEAMQKRMKLLEPISHDEFHELKKIWLRIVDYRLFVLDMVINKLKTFCSENFTVNVRMIIKGGFIRRLYEGLYTDFMTPSNIELRIIKLILSDVDICFEFVNGKPMGYALKMMIDYLQKNTPITFMPVMNIKDSKDFWPAGEYIASGYNILHFKAKIGIDGYEYDPIKLTTSDKIFKFLNFNVDIFDRDTTCERLDYQTNSYSLTIPLYEVSDDEFERLKKLPGMGLISYKISEYGLNSSLWMKYKSRSIQELWYFGLTSLKIAIPMYSFDGSIESLSAETVAWIPKLMNRQIKMISEGYTIEHGKFVERDISEYEELNSHICPVCCESCKDIDMTYKLCHNELCSEGNKICTNCWKNILNRANIPSEYGSSNENSKKCPYCRQYLVVKTVEYIPDFKRMLTYDYMFPDIERTPMIRNLTDLTPDMIRTRLVAVICNSSPTSRYFRGRVREISDQIDLDFTNLDVISRSGEVSPVLTDYRVAGDAGGGSGPGSGPEAEVEPEASNDSVISEIVLPSLWATPPPAGEADTLNFQTTIGESIYFNTIDPSLGPDTNSFIENIFQLYQSSM